MSTAAESLLDWNIVIHEHVTLSSEHALQTTAKNRQTIIIFSKTRGTNEHSFRMQQRFRENTQAGVTERGARGYHVGDQISHTELH